jgi:hypothetical protein
MARKGLGAELEGKTMKEACEHCDLTEAPIDCCQDKSEIPFQSEVPCLCGSHSFLFLITVPGSGWKCQKCGRTTGL